jgi:AraC-like DNA-binding protein
MSIKTAKPSKILQPFIKQYWCIENVFLNDEKHIQRIIPSGLPELSLYIGKRPKVLGNKRDLEDNFNLNGHQRAFYDLQIEKEISLFSIVFHPQGLMPFFNIPLNEIYNQSVPIRHLNKKFEQSMLPQLTNEQSFEKRVELVERYFCLMLEKEFNRFNFSRIDHAIKIISQARGKISIEQLASETCLSRKQFERKFSELIGITPKQYLKNIRLQYSLYLKSRNDYLTITDIAYEVGYYDQAHFINEFKMQTGFTPKQYFDNNVSYSDYFEQ